MPRPAPPWRSGMMRPAIPWATRPVQSSASWPFPAAAIARRRSIGRRSARKPRSEASSMFCSSDRAKSMRLAPCRGRGLRLARQPKTALSDDVLLDVGGAPADHEADVVHVIDMPCRGLIGLGSFILGVIGQSCSTQHINRERGQPVTEEGAVVFDDQTLEP